LSSNGTTRCACNCLTPFKAAAAWTYSGLKYTVSLAPKLGVLRTYKSAGSTWSSHCVTDSRKLATITVSATVYFSPEYVQAAAALNGVRQLQAQRVLPLLLKPSLPPVALIARELADPVKNLPLVGEALPVPAGQIGIYVSEAVVDLHGAAPGQTFAPLAKAFKPLTQGGQVPDASYFVAGVWRDYARQTGAIALDKAVFERLTGDRRANDLALWLTQPTDAPRVQEALRALADRTGSGAGELMEFGTPGQIRATSLRIFDRSFAVTYWLQAVAIAIGLFGVAASFSAQVLARRKEFGLLAHLGLTKRQILTVVAFEGAAWTLLGALAGLALGLVVSGVLVHVVNPQSFHWTMDLMLPWLKLLGLCLAVVAAGTLTAWLAAQAAAGQDAVLAVKEDW
jgi:putative ABC transport system permease protein